MDKSQLVFYEKRFSEEGWLSLVKKFKEGALNTSKTFEMFGCQYVVNNLSLNYNFPWRGHTLVVCFEEIIQCGFLRFPFENHSQ